MWKILNGGGYLEVAFVNVQQGDQFFEKQFPGPLQEILDYIPDNLRNSHRIHESGNVNYR
jgi:hypothetical protein